MATSGPNNPGTIANDTSIGTVNWSNTSNAASYDGTFATALLTASAATRFLKCTNYGFSIPAGATIDNVAVMAKRKCNSSLINDNSVRLVKGGTVSGNNKASGSTWPTTNTETSYSGAPVAYWNVALTDTDVNDSTFGVVVSAKNFDDASSDTASIDGVQITITYTEAAGGGQPASRRQVSITKEIGHEGVQVY